MIDQVVARRDAREHLAHSPRRVLLAGCAFRRRSFGECQRLSHRTFLSIPMAAPETVVQIAKCTSPSAGSHRQMSPRGRFVEPTRIVHGLPESSYPNASLPSAFVALSSATPAVGRSSAPAPQCATQYPPWLPPLRVPTTTRTSCPTPPLRHVESVHSASSIPAHVQRCARNSEFPAGPIPFRL